MDRDSTLNAPTELVVQAALLGAVAGMRSMSAPAILSEYFQTNPGAAGFPFPFDLLGEEWVATSLKAAAVGEMGADKLPITPNRTDALPLLGRIGIGATVGALYLHAKGESPLVGGIAGGIAAFLSTFLAYNVRKLAVSALHLPDATVALAEDALVTSSGLFFLRQAEANEVLG